MRVIHRIDDSIKKVELSVSEDRMKLFAKIMPKEEHFNATLEQLVEQISEITPAELLEMDVLRDVCKELREGKGCDNRRVARGKPAEPGRDGKVVWLARRFSPTAASNDQREFSDFFTLGLFENIEAGKEVARIYSPAGGAPGMDVLGKPVSPREGRNVAMRWDKTLELRSDPEQGNVTSVIATCAGYIHEEGNSAAIRDTIQIQQNLDWRTGHIDFVGSVRVSGDVQKGFHIKARGDITIGGNVLGENILSSGGSISIDGYHLGDLSVPVVLKEDYSVAIAQGVSVNAGGNIFIDREARDCTLRAGMAVLAGRASIVGGTVWCVKGVEADVLGNQAGVVTIVELRNELEVTKDYRTLADNIKKHEAGLAALELHIGPYLKNRRRVPLLNNQFRAKISALLDRYDQVSKSLDTLREQEKKMRESKQVPQDARISASTAIHAGVVLSSGDARLELKESVEGPVSFHRIDQRGEWLKDRFQSIKRG
jgi:uncharacterized protein (DUF342 family)